MSLKLKFNLSGNKDLKKTGTDQQNVPVIKIKPLILKREESGGVLKPKPPKEVKKLKLSLSRASSAVVLDNSSETPKQTPPQAIPKRIPKLRIKPTRIPGEGYDSEAPDVEDDPLVEQGIAVRFIKDTNLDFVSGAVERGDLSALNIKWITRDKAVVNVNLTLYLARLIDLPTITEIYKTLDKKNIFKTIDISQILLILRKINPKQLNMETDFEVPEEHTYTHPLYSLSVNSEIKPTKTVFRHGLSASLEDVYRRFRPRKTNHRLMTDIQLRVDDLIRRDTDAEESHYEYVNPKKQTHKFSDGSRVSISTSLFRPDLADRMLVDGSCQVEEQTDAEDQEELHDKLAQDLEADLDNVLERELADALDSTSNNAAATVLMKSEYENDEEGGDADEVGADEEEEEEDDDDDDENDDDDDDDEDAHKEDDLRAKKLEEEIAELQKATEKQKVLLAAASYKMMRMKFQSNYNHLKSQLDLKKRELSKVREQQQKQQSLPNHMPVPERPVNEDDDEEEDEEEEDDEEDEQNDSGDGENDAEPEREDEDKGDDFDEFQGLF